MADKKFRKLDGYAGVLTIEQAAAGMAAALSNARALLEDSSLLLRAERWSRAGALSILAIEEAGKIALIRKILLEDSESERRNLWRDYRSHTKKNFMGSLLEHVTEEPHIEDFRELFNPESESPFYIDAIKQLGFYSDCLGSGHWCVPKEVIDKELAENLFFSAQLATPKMQPPMCTVEELRLWIKHVKPVPRTNLNAMKQALISCYREAAEQGVLQGQNSVEDAIAFLS